LSVSDVREIRCKPYNATRPRTITTPAAPPAIRHGREARTSRLAKRLKGAEAVHQDDDCSARYDKISKQMDDALEGGSPQRFKRPKMESDIIALRRRMHLPNEKQPEAGLLRLSFSLHLGEVW
jgi:hypothetical protein